MSTGRSSGRTVLVRPLKHVMNPPVYDALWDAIAAELQRVADEAVETLWERSRNEQYGHAKAAVMLDIEAIEARFPKEGM